MDQFVPFSAGRICHDIGFAGKKVREKSHVVRMVGDDQEIE
jgi:hypothetical protein